MPKKKDIKIEDGEQLVEDEEQVDDEEAEESEGSRVGTGNSSDNGDDADDDSDDDSNEDVDVDSLIAEVEASQGNDAIRRREIRRRLEEIREARESARANAEPFDDVDDWD